jgi:hypothetical protein
MMNIRAQIFGGGEPAEGPILKAKKPKGAKPDTLHSVSVPRDVKRANNSRIGDRHRLSDERARVTHNGRDYDVELINLSGGGAMLAGPLQPKLWDRVRLHLGDHGSIECAVIWVSGERIGLEFAHETRLDGTAEQVATVLRHVMERTFPHIQLSPGSHKQAEAPPRSADQKEEHRSVPRHPLIWKGLLHHDYQSTEVRVRNISAIGAMIESRIPIRVGAQPLLELSEQASISASVEWAVGDQAGLKFNDPFDLHLLAQSKPEVAPARWTPPSYLKLGRKTQSQDHWERLDLHELRRELEGFLKH